MKIRFTYVFVCPAVLFTALALPARAVLLIDAISGSWTSNPIGTLSASNTNDWYTFYGTAGTVISLGINSANFDPKMFLYRTPNGPAVAGDDVALLPSSIAVDDDSGPGLLPLISNFTLPATSYYLVRVNEFPPFNGPPLGGSYGQTFFTGNITAGPVSSTPDAGATASLLALALAALAGARRWLG
jgi:VPDSG-CTERM motif